MKRPAAAVAGALAVTALGAGLAHATSTRDRDDVATALDIAKASGAHNRASDELVHTIDFYGPVTPATMVTNKGKPPSSVCVEIWTRSTPRESPPDYEVCAGVAKGGKAWTGSIARERERGPQLRVGSVKIEQPSDTRLVLRIDPDDIKRPSSYQWRTESTSFGSDCKSSTGCADYAPDRPATAATRLSTPR
jgi:hypothetical protein